VVGSLQSRELEDCVQYTMPSPQLSAPEMTGRGELLGLQGSQMRLVYPLETNLKLWAERGLASDCKAAECGSNLHLRVLKLGVKYEGVARDCIAKKESLEPAGQQNAAWISTRG